MKITATMLAELERQFSGGFEFVTPPQPSEHDSVVPPKSVFDGHRFQPRGTCKNRAHDYGPRYETALSKFNTNDELIIVEMGVLRGVGLAIWCHLFPHARVIGLDVDLKHFNNNLGNLTARGAFQYNAPEVYRYDELSTKGYSELANLLRGRRIDIFIDDALHYATAILHAFKNVRDFMQSKGVYIIEDNKHSSETINLYYGRQIAKQYDELAVVDFEQINTMGAGNDGH